MISKNYRYGASAHIRGGRCSLCADPEKRGTLVFGRGGDSVGLDPAYESDGNSFHDLRQCF